jgi:hypothetical protein
VVSVTALGVGIAAMNDDVRHYFQRLLSRDAMADVRDTGWYIQDASHAVMQAFKDQSIEHAPLMIFAVAAGVLVLFMLRT